MNDWVQTCMDVQQLTSFQKDRDEATAKQRQPSELDDAATNENPGATNAAVESPEAEAKAGIAESHPENVNQRASTHDVVIPKQPPIRSSRDRARDSARNPVENPEDPVMEDPITQRKARKLPYGWSEASQHLGNLEYPWPPITPPLKADTQVSMAEGKPENGKWSPECAREALLQQSPVSERKGEAGGEKTEAAESEEKPAGTQELEEAAFKEPAKEGPDAREGAQHPPYVKMDAAEWFGSPWYHPPW